MPGLVSQDSISMSSSSPAHGRLVSSGSAGGGAGGGGGRYTATVREGGESGSGGRIWSGSGGNVSGYDEGAGVGGGGFGFGVGDSGGGGSGNGRERDGPESFGLSGSRCAARLLPSKFLSFSFQQRKKHTQSSGEVEDFAKT